MSWWTLGALILGIGFGMAITIMIICACVVAAASDRRGGLND